MKCPSCGRLMINMITFLKCSNCCCDYEEDVELQQEAVKSQQQSVENYYGSAAA
ncbi:MAG: hypothetical protein ACLPN1_12235 [Dissulfurispiraceae bacterium]|jgi:hypothetical protein